MELKKIKILINSNGTYLDTILPPITANEDGRTIVQVIAPFPITDIVSVNYSIRPIQATVKGSYLVPTGKFGKDVLADDYTHFQTVADWNVFEIPINAVALEYISKYRAGLVLVSFTIKQLQTPYFATNYLGLFSNTQPIPATSYNDGDYFIANEYNFTAHDITWAKGDYAYFYNGKWNKGKSVLKASTPSIELPVDPSLKDAPQLEYDEDVALLLANDLGLLTQRVSQSETDIESAENDINEIDGRVGVNETDIYNLESDVGNLQSDKADKTELVPIISELERLENEKVDLSLYTYDKGLQNTRDNAQENRLDTVEIDVANLENQNLLHSPTFNGTNGHLTFQRYGASPIVIDLPTEMIVTSGVYDDINNELVLNLASGGEVRIPVGNLLTDLDAENIRYNGAGTYYLSGKNRVEQAINELDTQIKVLSDNKVDKDFTSYNELTAPEVADDDLVIVRDVSSNTTKKMRVSTLRQHEGDTIEYGVRWNINQTSPVGVRLKRVNGELFVGEATNMIANIGIDDQVVENSFDNVDMFNIVKTVINGNIMTGRKAYYHKTEFVVIDGETYIEEWVTQKLKVGMANYYRPSIFIDKNGNDIPIAYLSSYEATTVDNIARSISGRMLSHSLTINTARQSARRNDGDGSNTDSLWGIKDRPEYFYHIELPFWIEFATRHSQSIMNGVISLPYNESNVSLYAESDTNRVVIENSFASQFVVGQTISIGTTRGDYSVARERRIVSITLDDLQENEASIVFDGDPVNTLVGSVVYSMGWVSGITDNIRASSGVFTENNGKYPIVFRGYENPWGNLFKFVDGVKISNNWAWICLNREAYDDVASVDDEYGSNWIKLSYQNALTDGYAKVLGYDARFPFARFPTEIGATSSTYYADYYYQNNGDRSAIVGGSWYTGGYAGVSLWSLVELGYSSLDIGFRLSYRPLQGGLIGGIPLIGFKGLILSLSKDQRIS